MRGRVGEACGGGDGGACESLLSSRGLGTCSRGRLECSVTCTGYSAMESLIKEILGAVELLYTIGK